MTMFSVLNRFIVLTLTGSLILMTVAVILVVSEEGWPLKVLALLDEAPALLAVTAAPATTLALTLGLVVDGIAACTIRRLIARGLTRTHRVPLPVWVLCCKKDWLQYQFYFEEYYLNLHRAGGLPDSWKESFGKVQNILRSHDPLLVKALWRIPVTQPNGMLSPVSSNDIRVMTRAWAAACFMSDAEKRDASMVSNHWLLYILATNLVALSSLVGLIVAAAIYVLSPTHSLWAWLSGAMFLLFSCLILLRGAVIHYMYAYELVLRHGVVAQRNSRPTSEAVAGRTTTGR